MRCRKGIVLQGLLTIQAWAELGQAQVKPEVMIEFVVKVGDEIVVEA